MNMSNNSSDSSSNSKKLDERSVLADRFVPSKWRQINAANVTMPLSAVQMPSPRPEYLFPSLVPPTPVCHCAIKHPLSMTSPFRTISPELRFALLSTLESAASSDKMMETSSELPLPTVDKINDLQTYCSTFEKLLWQERRRLLCIYEQYSQYNYPADIRHNDNGNNSNNNNNLSARITIPGIADARPFLQTGDVVLFRPMRSVSLPSVVYANGQPPPPPHQQYYHSSVHQYATSTLHSVEIDAHVVMTQRGGSNNKGAAAASSSSAAAGTDVVITTWLDPVSNRTLRDAYRKQRFNVRFVPSVKLYERCLTALDWLRMSAVTATTATSNSALIMDLLFPNRAPNLRANKDMEELAVALEQQQRQGGHHEYEYKDLNDKQRKFVRMVCLRTAVPSTNEIRPPMLLTGPAGTGKTRTLLQAIIQVLQQQPQNENDSSSSSKEAQRRQCILVCTPSHTAADVVTKRLASMMMKNNNDDNNNTNGNYSPKSRIFRLYDSDQPVETVPAHLLQYCCQTSMTGTFALPPIKELFAFQIIVCTCSDAHLLYRAGLTNAQLRVRRRCFQTYLQRTMSECNMSLRGDDAIRGVDEPHFTHLFIDEAAQATEPETLIPLSVVVDPMPGNRKVEIVLVGDPRQLSPNVYCPKAADCGLGKSLLERLLQRPVQCLGGGHPDMLGPPTLGNLHTMEDWIQYAFQKEGQDYLSVFLTMNYRGHESFLMMPSTLFYFDKLQCAKTNGQQGVSTSSSAWINKLRVVEQLSEPVTWLERDVALPPTFQPQREASSSWPIHFRGVAGQDTSVALDSLAGGATDSWSNMAEAKVVVDIVLALSGDRTAYVPTQSIGVMAPFRAQVVLIRTLLREKNLGAVNVGTIEDYQAVERDVIVLSLTRSNSKFVPNDVERRMGVFQQPKRTNVATTRAENLFIVVGNPVVMSKDPIWRQWLWFFLRNGFWYGENGGKEISNWFSRQFRCVRHRPGIDSVQFMYSTLTSKEEQQDDDDIVTISTLEQIQRGKKSNARGGHLTS